MRQRPDAGLRESLRAELESTRIAFHQLLDELSDQDLGIQSLNPAWTVREMLYHMSLAPRNLPSDVRLIRHLKWVPKFPAGPFNRMNVYLTRRGARDATKDSLAETYDQAHARTIQALISVKDEQWELGVNYPDWDPLLGGFVTLERLFHYIKLHFESHARDIRLAIADKNDRS